MWQTTGLVVMLALASAALSRAAQAADAAANAGVSSSVSLESAADDPPPNDAQPRALRRLAQQLAAPPTAANPSASGSEDTPLTPLTRVEQTPLGASAASGTSPKAATESLPPRDGSWVLSTLTALGVVLGLVFLIRWGWVKMGGSVAARGCQAVEVLSRTAVAPKNHIVLVRVGGRILVVSDSAAGLRTLADVEDPDEVAGLLEAVTATRGNSVTRGFAQMLSSNDRSFTEGMRLAEEGGDRREHQFDRARDSVSGLVSRIRTLSQRGGVS